MIILALIIIVATVNIIGTLLMLILGKSREIGTLITIGMERKENREGISETRNANRNCWNSIG